MSVRRVFDPRAPLGVLAYLTGCAAAYVSQPLYVLAVGRLAGRDVPNEALLWLVPFRRLAQMENLPPAFLAGGLVLMMAAACVLALLSVRRAAADGGDVGMAAVAIVPMLQVVAVTWFAIVPLFERAPAKPDAAWAGGAWVAVIQGVLAGVGLMVFAVAVSTLVFGRYGFGLFVLSPLLIGFATGYLVNRRAEGPRTSGATMGWVFAATFVGSAMLLMFQLEGGVCMIMATPILGLPAMAGGLLGRQFIVAGRNRARPVVMSLAVMPLAFAIDAALPDETVLTTYETREIAAPPAAVWAALVDMGEIAPAPALPFRLGLAYPVRAEFRGEGVGAERIGVFSTGEARERVTAWEPEQRLAFDVLSNPPAMRELSPYKVVHAPHTEGYFATRWTRFELTPTASGGTRLVERAEHRLRLEPVVYWAPMARWVIDANNARVLAHIRRRAEAAALTVAAAPPSR